MNLLIHDLKEIDSEKILENNSEETIFVSDNGKIKPCNGCECCITSTPGQCTIKDGYENLCVLLSKCNKLILISKCFYGGYSPFVKNVLERIADTYLLPSFIKKNGETHRLHRYSNDINLCVHFYGIISQKEKETAKKLVKANEINFCKESSIFFYHSSEEIKGI